MKILVLVIEIIIIIIIITNIKSNPFLIADNSYKDLPAPLRSKWRSHYSNVTSVAPYMCLEHAKWYFCHIVFPVCVTDKTNETLKEFQVCQRSCLSLLSAPPCKAMIPDKDLIVATNGICKTFFSLDDLSFFYCLGPRNGDGSDCLSKSRK